MAETKKKKRQEKDEGEDGSQGGTGNYCMAITQASIAVKLKEDAIKIPARSASSLGRRVSPDARQNRQRSHPIFQAF